MVNVEEFTNRISKVMEYYDLSAASFADKIDVGRSSISHLLSGRNKPSLDFVMKIVKAFPEVELYWLLNGKGSFPNKPIPAVEKNESVRSPEVDTQDLFTPPTAVLENTGSENKAGTGKKIQKIVIFYSDGTFDAYENWEGGKRS